MTDVTNVHRLLHRHRLLQLVGRSGAHSLRNVSQTLQMSADVLRGIPDADLSIPALVDEASFRLLNLADRLGQWSSTKVRAPQPAALAAILAPLPDLLHNHPRRDSLALEITIPEDYPLVNVISDDLLEVVWELVSNALEAGSPGTTVNVRIRATVGAAVAALTVEDNGPGVASTAVASLFSVNERGPGEVPQLGLAVAQRLLRDQDGDIEFRPLSAGALFVCTMPIWRKS